MDKLRKIPFIIALILMLLVLGVQLGGPSFLPSPQKTEKEILETIGDDAELVEAYEEDLDEEQRQALLDQDAPPGVAIRTMALVDGLLLFAVAMIGLAILLKERLFGKLQGIVTLIVSLLTLIGAVVLILTVLLPVLMLMIGLLLAIPFGTLTYMALYGFFARGGAAVLLGLLMSLKVGFGVCMLLAHQRFLQNKSLVLLVLTSFLCVVIVGLLHGIVPGFLVSITDAVAAIVLAILAAIWALIFLIGSIGPVLKALRLDRA